ILNSKELPNDVMLLLKNLAFVNMVQYVKRSFAFRRSLVKTKVESASVAFFFYKQIKVELRQ
ncbi:2826_t:CDS:1, partial [Acaulospora morrowiae]